jgi:hypothetical protein
MVEKEEEEGGEDAKACEEVGFFRYNWKCQRSLAAVSQVRRANTGALVATRRRRRASDPA